MRKRTVWTSILAATLCLALSHAVLSLQCEQCPCISPQSRPFVDRRLASKPGDLFVVLKNGLTLLVHQMPEAGVVSAQVFVRAGAVMEGQYTRGGLSHYLEHIVVSGSTLSMSEQQARDRIEAIGGAMDAYTSYDRTVFYINAGVRRWREALDILLSKVTENSIAPEDVAREKKVIVQEMAMRESNPSDVLWDLFMQTAYLKSPVRYPVVGYPCVFARQGRDALLDYYHRRYQPQNMIVVVAGNVSASRVLQFVAEKTKNFEPANSAPVVIPREPRQICPRWAEKVVPVTRLVQAMIGFPSVNAYGKDLYALDVLAQVLGQGETCRLYCSMKEKHDKVFGVGATNWTPAFVRGQFIISVSMSGSQWPSALKCIDSQIQRLKDAPVSQAELTKAQKTAIAQHIFRQESVESMASSLASSFLLTGDPYFDAEYVDGIRSVSAQEVQAAARRYLVADHRTVALIKPASAATVTAAAAPCPAPELSRVAYTRMKNGLKLLIKPNRNLPIVSLQLWGIGGLALETAKNPGLSAFTAALITAGTKTNPKTDLIQDVEDLGGLISAGSDYNTYHISIKVLKEDFPVGLRLLADMAQNASFPPDQIEKQKQDTLTAIQLRDQNWRTEVIRLFMKNYFHNNPYANYKLGTTASVKSFTRNQVVAFYHKMVNPTHSVLAIYGDVDPQEAQNLANREFGKWSGKPVAVSLPHTIQPLETNRLVEVRDEKNTSALFVGTNGLSVKDPRKPVLDVLNEILSGGGSLSGRMFDSLRGGKNALVYTVSTFPFYGLNCGFFGVLTQTSTANLPLVQKIIEQNLDRLKDQLVSESELQRAKEALLVGLRFDRETIGTQAQDAALDEVLGLGWNYSRRYPPLVRAVTTQQVRDLARSLFTCALVAETAPARSDRLLLSAPAKENPSRK